MKNEKITIWYSYLLVLHLSYVIHLRQTNLELICWEYINFMVNKQAMWNVHVVFPHYCVNLPLSLLSNTPSPLVTITHLCLTDHKYGSIGEPTAFAWTCHNSTVNIRALLVKSQVDASGRSTRVVRVRQKALISQNTPPEQKSSTPDERKVYDNESYLKKIAKFILFETFVVQQKFGFSVYSVLIIPGYQILKILKIKPETTIVYV